MNQIENIMALAKEYRDAIIEDGIKRQALRAAIEQALAVQPKQEAVEFKHVCNLWIDPVSRYYIIDRCDHPPSECIPAYIRTATRPQPEKNGGTK